VSGIRVGRLGTTATVGSLEREELTVRVRSGRSQRRRPLTSGHVIRQTRGEYDFIAVANRLPVDRVESPDGSVEWRHSPGGLVSALEPVMRRADGAWVGWSGLAGEVPDPFDADDMHLVGVPLSAEEVEDFYEGFSTQPMLIKNLSAQRAERAGLPQVQLTPCL
jgi:hypothetical protein